MIPRRGRNQPLHFGGTKYIVEGVKKSTQNFSDFSFLLLPKLLRGVILADYLWYVLSKENAA